MQNQYSIRFKEASRTGSKCLWLKAVKNCDCYDEDRLIDSEPDPKCPKCYGLGKIRQAILTDKIRNEINNSYISQFEKTKFTTSINEDRKFYVDKLYQDMNTEDLICLLKEDEKTIVSVYKIVNREEFRDHDFIFYEIIGRKINFIKKFEISDFDKLIELRDD